MQVANYVTKSIDHLGLVAALCKELGIAEFIDARIPNQSPFKHITYGQLLVAMILNGLGFVSRTLHMYPDYFADKPIERLLGTDIKASHINDDVLGRGLDKFYELGVSELYQALAEKAVVYLGLPCEAIHLDATSFHVDGEYAADIDATHIRLVPGYSRDHRPALNQVILNLITENQAGLPVYMQACSGNTHDSESFKALVKAHIGSLKAAARCRYLIGDAALYVADTIKALDAQQQLFISRVPQTLTEAKKLIAQHPGVEFTPLANGYSGAWFEVSYAEVSQKWLLVRSEQANHRESRTLHKTLAKNTAQAAKAFAKLCQQAFACEADAKQALDTWKTAQPAVRVTEGCVVPRISYTTRGRPKASAPAKTRYFISGQLYTCLQHKQTQAAQKGVFILATNDCSNRLSMQAILDHYKSQQAVERGFRFLKSPDFLVSSLFLKKPERIEALLMVMTCCLMIYAALEHLIRKQLAATNLFFPDMKKKPTQKPTARWVFFCFQGIDELTIDQTHSLVINLQERQKTILTCLGPPYQQIYS